MGNTHRGKSVKDLVKERLDGKFEYKRENPRPMHQVIKKPNIHHVARSVFPEVETKYRLSLSKTPTQIAMTKPKKSANGPSSKQLISHGTPTILQKMKGSAADPIEEAKASVMDARNTLVKAETQAQAIKEEIQERNEKHGFTRVPRAISKLVS